MRSLKPRLLDLAHHESMAHPFEAGYAGSSDGFSLREHPSASRLEPLVALLVLRLNALKTHSRVSSCLQVPPRSSLPQTSAPLSHAQQQ